MHKRKNRRNLSTRSASKSQKPLGVEESSMSVGKSGAKSREHNVPLEFTIR